MTSILQTIGYLQYILLVCTTKCWWGQQFNQVHPGKPCFTLHPPERQRSQNISCIAQIWSGWSSMFQSHRPTARWIWELCTPQIQKKHTSNLLCLLAYKTSMSHACIEYADFMYHFTCGMPHSSIVSLSLHTCNHKRTLHVACVFACISDGCFLLRRAQSRSLRVSWLASRSLMSLASTHKR